MQKPFGNFPEGFFVSFILLEKFLIADLLYTGNNYKIGTEGPPMPRPKLISTCISWAVTLLDYLKKTLLSEFWLLF